MNVKVKHIFQFCHPSTYIDKHSSYKRLSTNNSKVSIYETHFKNFSIEIIESIFGVFTQKIKNNK